MVKAPSKLRTLANNANSAAAVSKRNQPAVVIRNAVTDPTGRITEYASANDRCPICKSDRYLNPNLRLLVSKCYHKMCESCIDRIFTLGPEPCPAPGCGVELRKSGFAAQTFEDLGVEKEVTIRKRIAKCFNKRQVDFADLKAYNDYLEEVEEITFNLINSVDVAATETRIKAYQRANAALIATNARLSNDESKEQQTMEAREATERQARRQLAADLEMTESTERNQGELVLIDLLGKTSDDKEASGLFRKARKEAMLKRKQAEVIPEEWARLMGPSVADMGMDMTDRNLLEDAQARRSNWFDYSSMMTLPSLQDGYASDPWSTFNLPQESEMAVRSVVGGYRRDAFWERCVRSAIQGIFVQPLGDSV